MRVRGSGFADATAVVERIDAAAEFAQRDFLDLADAFAGHFELLPYVVQRPRFLPVQAETHGHDFSLTRCQILEMLADFLPHRLYAKQFVGGQRPFVLDDVAESVVVLVAYRGIEAGGSYAVRAKLGHLGRRSPQMFGQLDIRWLMPQRFCEFEIRVV